MNRAQAAVSGIVTAFRPTSSQEVLDLGSALFSAGLACFDAVEATSVDHEGIISGDEANNLTHGMAWMFVDDLGGTDALSKFCDTLSVFIAGKAAGLSASERSDVTVRMAQMFGDVVANIISSTMPEEVSDEDLDAMAKLMAGQAISAAIQQAAACAMKQMQAETAKAATSAVSPSQN